MRYPEYLTDIRFNSRYVSFRRSRFCSNPESAAWRAVEVFAVGLFGHDLDRDADLIFWIVAETDGKAKARVRSLVDGMYISDRCHRLARDIPRTIASVIFDCG